MTDELFHYQNMIGSKAVVRAYSTSGPRFFDLNAHIRHRYPAKNGFIAVFDKGVPIPLHLINKRGDRPEPQDVAKVSLQLDLVQGSHPRLPVLYFKYLRPARVVQMTGTFSQNERVPTPGQRVWVNPLISGDVVRVCTGTPDLLTFVDIRVDGIMMTRSPSELFDHEPEIVEYKVPEGTMYIWE